MKSDQTIQEEVLEELRQDERVDATDVGVSVRGAVVTLSGEVADHRVRAAAVELAHRVAGVLDVVDHLEVRLPPNLLEPGLRRSDVDLARAVRREVTLAVGAQHDRIRATVARGHVALEGDADAAHLRDRIGRAVAAVPGVTHVENRVRALGPPERAEAVRAAIAYALEDAAETLAERIQVSVADDRATVRGTVRTAVERRAAIRAAGETPGINAVVDDLRVDPAA
jgi:osmotically-inducible protein OsmY